jgi:hypothetical protein
VEKIHPSPHRRGKNMHSARRQSQGNQGPFSGALRPTTTARMYTKLGGNTGLQIQPQRPRCISCRGGNQNGGHARTNRKSTGADGFIDAFYMAYWEHNQARHRGCIKRNVCAARRLLKHPKLGEHYAHSQKARGHNSHRLSAYKCDA